MAASCWSSRLSNSAHEGSLESRTIPSFAGSGCRNSLEPREEEEVRVAARGSVGVCGSVNSFAARGSRGVGVGAVGSATAVVGSGGVGSGGVGSAIGGCSVANGGGVSAIKVAARSRRIARRRSRRTRCSWCWRSISAISLWRAGGQNCNQRRTNQSVSEGVRECLNDAEDMHVCDELAYFVGGNHRGIESLLETAIQNESAGR